MGGLVLWWRMGSIVGSAIAGLAAALAMFAWIAPARYAPVQRGLDCLAHVFVAGLSWFLLGLIYFGLFTPLRMWRALTRHEAFPRRPDPAATTYLRSSPPVAPDHFNRQF